MTNEGDQAVFGAKTSRGFTLLEVLVALLVLAIGLVGIASLQVTGLRNAHSSYYTTIASSVALDLEERLWVAMTDIDQACLTEDMVNNIIGNPSPGGGPPPPLESSLLENWSALEGGRVVIPGLGVEMMKYETGKLDVDAEFPAWVEVRIRVTWTDERFGPGAEESFPYTARVVCAPGIAE